MEKLRSWVRLGVVVVCALVWASQAGAFTIKYDTMSTIAGESVYTFADGDRAARASFGISGGDLIVTLTNTTGADLDEPIQILTALFFDVADQPAFSPVDALLGSGSVVYSTKKGLINVPGGDVSSEWAYATNVPTLPAYYAISSVGLDDLIGPKDRFDTNGNLAGPASPNGMQYGIVSTGDDMNTANGGMAKNPVIQDTVVFTFTNLATDFELADIGNVWFHYGTSYTPVTPPEEPPGGGNPPVPEPVTVTGMSLALAALGWYRRRRA